MRKRAHTYRAGADGCGASAGRVVTMGLQHATTGTEVKKIRATTGMQQPMTGTGSGDDGCRIG